MAYNNLEVILDQPSQNIEIYAPVGVIINVGSALSSLPVESEIGQANVYVFSGDETIIGYNSPQKFNWEANNHTINDKKAYFKFFNSSIQNQTVIIKADFLSLTTLQTHTFTITITIKSPNLLKTDSSDSSGVFNDIRLIDCAATDNGNLLVLEGISPNTLIPLVVEK